MNRFVLLLGLHVHLLCQGFLTIPEQSQYQRTSTTNEVKLFMGSLQRIFPELQNYHPPKGPTQTEGGQPLMAWRIKSRQKNPIRVYINANIHAGEVEGKEAVQMLVREWLQGRHVQLRDSIDLVVMPCYNAEGTDLLDPQHRMHQPNPASGVGTRENAKGLDLNRDLMKVETTNTSWFLRMLRDYNPHVVIDLHTTNGSYHGFYLTYAPALSPGFDPLMELNKNILLDVRKELKKKGFPVFDYGNYVFENPAPEISPSSRDQKIVGNPNSWETFDWRPRFLTNYPVLQGRLSILSEAYVYRSFKERVLDTKTFVLECLKTIRRRAASIKTITTEAQKELPKHLPLKAIPKISERYLFDLIEPLKDEKGRLIGEQSRIKVDLPAMTSYQYLDWVSLPEGYLIFGDRLDDIKEKLSYHGIHFEQIFPDPVSYQYWTFIEDERVESSRSFQGIRTLNLEGHWLPLSNMDTKALLTKEKLHTAIYVPLAEGKSRLAFYLIDPRSPDGLIYWRILNSDNVLAIAPKKGQLVFPDQIKGHFVGEE
ncbi:MAG: M14 family zinc carboxypeptidase [Holophagaceae bacterium]|jgi:hypothetical protein